MSKAWLTRSVNKLWTPNYLKNQTKINKLGNPARFVDYSKSYTGDTSYMSQFLGVSQCPLFSPGSSKKQVLQKSLCAYHLYSFRPYYRTNMSNTVFPHR